MNNAIYGKTMEKLRNRIDVRLINNEKDYLKWASKLSCTSHKIFDNNLVVMHKSKVTLKVNKPAYIGMCILELSKVFFFFSSEKRSRKKTFLLYDILLIRCKLNHQFIIYMS